MGLWLDAGRSACWFLGASCQDHESHVIVLGSGTSEPADVFQDCLLKAMGTIARVFQEVSFSLQEIEEAQAAEELALLVLRVGDAVRIENQRIAALELDDSAVPVSFLYGSKGHAPTTTTDWYPSE